MSRNQLEMTLFLTGNAGEQLPFGEDNNRADIYLSRELWEQLGCPTVISVFIEKTN